MNIAFLVLALTSLQAARPVIQENDIPAAPVSREAVRTMHYYPDGRDIVCLDGDGRYTRPLYGTGTTFRLETSDRPVFAVYDRSDSFNFTFYLDGKPLDEAAHCIARYRGGVREYELSDPSWGGGRLCVSAMASFFEEGAIWKFDARGFDAAPSLKVVRRRIACTKMFRAGDLGTDPREYFEAAQDDPGESLEWSAEGETYVRYRHKKVLELSDVEVYGAEAAAQKRREERIEFNTPDPFINTIGSCLTEAVEGIWDDESGTWLHGANGWRTQLAGWRGAFAGDATGLHERSRHHFDTYLESMITDTPAVLDHPQPDPAANLCRGVHEWGTPLYSNGYIPRRPHRREISHYDMNLNFFDELLEHVNYDADTVYLRKIWPYLGLHLDWEKRNFDPDSDHLYDAYCCIWASDALYYNSGAVTHSSAYNWRCNSMAARIAEILGENPEPYRQEADAILEALDSRLWLPDEGHWAECQDYMGLRRLHKDAAVWSVYVPVDCGACTPDQAWRATGYVSSHIPHIPVRYRYDRAALRGLGLTLPPPDRDLETISTSDWMPYAWSTNNVAHEEVTNTALAFFKAGRADEGFRLLKSTLVDEMYLGLCPGNFGQISHYDKARAETYRDFADNVGITARTLVSGLFGIQPEALRGRCVIAPGFPSDWKKASVKTPYLSYSWRREGRKDVYEIEQHFPRPLTIVVRQYGREGKFVEVAGTCAERQTIVVDSRGLGKAAGVRSRYKRAKFSRKEVGALGLGRIRARSEKVMVDISASFNSNVDDVFRNEYLSPRSPYTTLSLPKQGVSEWCRPLETFEIEDEGFREQCRSGVFDTGLSLTFLSPPQGRNIAYASLWDNYPGAVEVPLEGRARAAYLLMAGTTQNMQSHIANGRVTAVYADGSTTQMQLVNPYNWCPIERDYFVDGLAFSAAPLLPYRVLLSDGSVSRNLCADGLLDVDPDSADSRYIPSGACQILRMPLDRSKSLKALRVEALSCDVVIGLMAVTLEK